MKWFINLPTRTKLLIVFGGPIFLLLVVSATAYSSFVSLRRTQTQLYQQDFADAIDILRFRAEVNGIQAAVTNLALSNREEQAAALQDIRERRERIDAALQGLLERNRQDPTFFNRLQELKALRENSRRVRDDEILPLIERGRVEEARPLLTGVQQQLYKQISDLSLNLSQEKVGHAAAAITDSERLIGRQTLLILLLGATAVVLSIVLAWWLSRIIARPVSRMALAAEQVARGDMSAEIPVEGRKDEVGQLQQAFHRMIGGLRDINREISRTANVLASSASEILSAATQVAAGAAETATAVSQTTATVEEVKQTSQLASQKAKRVSDSANRAAMVSANGRKSVDELIESMSLVRDQMESIAESIVGLSEQTQTIGEIISSVNDLAEQSNLLAVNAAIEAARAGEQGKGFAVVAQEVRSLAEQSKQATAQVRAILTDIQKATTAAALAAEQGSRTVDVGVKRSNEAREAIRLLAESVAEASQAATQIAASSQQQTVGMDEMAMAMSSIKQASQQNVQGSRQAETAARNLYDLGQKLKLVVERYRE